MIISMYLRKMDRREYFMRMVGVSHHDMPHVISA